ncbi:MAG: Tyrosine-specific transport protein [Chlamydiales bacterium]|nr:Tyrosine-specific transport protein [Chlamydiales bacterium]MCH9635121.1 Tyrosine-specific transport protein [Chlamydiales bacterium]MCH9703588.1 amino acid permease [Chlamydiota bacterium]
MSSKENRSIGAILLVSGTTIGAAMLALPLTTGLSGFWPSVLVMSAVWCFMLLTAFYLLEVNLRMRGESNIISMASKTLGKGGQIACWIIYLLLLYTIMSAYLVGCSDIVGQCLMPFFDLPLCGWPIILFFIFAGCIFFGTSVVDWLNRLLMVLLFVAFFLLLGMGFSHVQPKLLSHVDWSYLLPSFSVVLTTFGFHIIIPTLTTYLEHDSRLLKRAIFIGSVVPLLLYILWQMLVMGVVPVSKLVQAAEVGEQITVPLQAVLGSPLISTAAKLFALASIITSLLGVSLSLSDFLADGLKLEKRSWNKLWIVLLTFTPPLLFTLFFPRGFLFALKYAGIFVVILLALLPAWMAYYERYGPETERSFIPSDFKVPGGKWAVVGTIVLSLVILVVEIVK